MIQRIHDSGEVAKTYRYDAFGNEETPEPLDANPFRYCGEYFDAETATLYLRARSYDARSGRFTQEDSAKDGGNWYAYCGGNPVGMVDPSGNYYIVANANGYAVQRSHEYILMALGLAGFARGLVIPNVASSLVWRSPANTVGGTSHNVQSHMGELWGDFGSLMNINEALQMAMEKAKIDPDVMPTPLGACSIPVASLDFADLMLTKGAVAEEDTVLFQLISYYDLPTTFSNQSDAERQMNILRDIYANNQSYLLGSGGSFEGSQFQKDLKLVGKKSSDILIMQEELNLSMWEVFEAQAKDKDITKRYFNQSQYTKRMQNLRNEWKKRQ